MSKELKALENIKQGYCKYRMCPQSMDACKMCSIGIIETSLKEYELMKQTKIIVADKKISDDDLEKLKNQKMIVDSLEQCEIKPLFDEEIQKKLKALEIIKKKHVDVSYLQRFSHYLYIYNHMCENAKEHCGDQSKKELALLPQPLTQEEYDILKEVLCNGR